MLAATPRSLSRCYRYRERRGGGGWRRKGELERELREKMNKRRKRGDVKKMRQQKREEEKVRNRGDRGQETEDSHMRLEEK